MPCEKSSKIIRQPNTHRFFRLVYRLRSGTGRQLGNVLTYMGFEKRPAIINGQHGISFNQMQCLLRRRTMIRLNWMDSSRQQSPIKRKAFSHRVPLAACPPVAKRRKSPASPLTPIALAGPHNRFASLALVRRQFWTDRFVVPPLGGSTG
jgi:hypothetical protein